MTLNSIVRVLGARVLSEGDLDSVEICGVYAGDRMSDLLNHVSDQTLLVTNLANAALMRVTDLMDLPAICLVNDVEPEPGMLQEARRHGVTLMVSPEGMFETCGRLYQAMVSVDWSES